MCACAQMPPWRLVAPSPTCCRQPLSPANRLGVIEAAAMQVSHSRFKAAGKPRSRAQTTMQPSVVAIRRCVSSPCSAATAAVPPPAYCGVGGCAYTQPQRGHPAGAGQQLQRLQRACGPAAAARTARGGGAREPARLVSRHDWLARCGCAADAARMASPDLPACPVCLRVAAGPATHQACATESTGRARSSRGPQVRAVCGPRGLLEKPRALSSLPVPLLAASSGVERGGSARPWPVSALPQWTGTLGGWSRRQRRRSGPQTGRP